MLPEEIVKKILDYVDDMEKKKLSYMLEKNILHRQTDYSK